MAGRVLAMLFPAVLLVLGCGGEPETAARPETFSGVSSDTGSNGISDMREAEKEGRAYPTAPPPERRAPVFSGPAPGSSGRECVALPAKNARRSGEFATKLFYLRDEKGPGGWGAKMPWSPLHLREEYFANKGDVRGVTVRVASLEAPREIKTQRLKRTSGFGKLGVAYPSYLRLPGGGPWRVVVTSGPDWGCFDVQPAADEK